MSFEPKYELCPGTELPKAAVNPGNPQPLLSPPLLHAPPFLKGKEDKDSRAISHETVASDKDEEAPIFTTSRMLLDPATGRLLYIGDSASLSFLQLVRMIVENVSGRSPFTTDPRRHQILENTTSIPQGFRHTHVLPDSQTALILVESFFINTNGILHVFDEKLFFAELERCYFDPLKIDPSWLCLLNLVFSIGLLLASPAPNTIESNTIEKLRAEPIDHAEIFYLNAKNLNDPSSGFEDAGYWSIQALLLMTLYMLAVSKRNAAFAYFGMAVRSAFALGLHREETYVIFQNPERKSRRNLWRSLYIFDRFLSLSLGRPTAISEDDCSGDTLKPIEFSLLPPPIDSSEINFLGLQASLKTCHVIGIILKKVYQTRRVSTKLAQEIAEECKKWHQHVGPSLHWAQASTATPSQGVAILHVNLFYCHSIILLCRPFFLAHLMGEIKKASGTPMLRPQRFGQRMERFALACVIASTHSILLVQNAFDRGILSRRNPVSLYFLFAASLIVLSNEFGQVYVNPPAKARINSAIHIMAYCAETDPQALRLMYILTTFRDVVASQNDRPRTRLLPTAEDPMANLFTPLEADFPLLPPPGDERVRTGSLSEVLDLGAMPGPLTVGSDDSSGEEAIDFESFWNWPLGAQRFDGAVVGDGSVPLYALAHGT
ncbi:MAG: hypothetical protein M1829_000986 [Trizodia sp. TS-e1964]|nr:MAG: hypothetical protein M1829_000986 [Trizodia sp. TS-e1964]